MGSQLTYMWIPIHIPYDKGDNFQHLILCLLNVLSAIKVRKKFNHTPLWEHPSGALLGWLLYTVRVQQKGHFKRKWPIFCYLS